MSLLLVATTVLGAGRASAAGCNASLPFCDPTVPTKARIEDFLSRATTMEKAGLLFGQSISRLGVPKLSTGEALHGVADGCKSDGRPGGKFCPSSFPCALNLGATLNESLWHAIGSTISTESRALKPTGGARFTPDINVSQRFPYSTLHCNMYTLHCVYDVSYRQRNASAVPRPTVG